MRLKKIEILGFKSFAHKTVVTFSDGITAVVGPNGCGKTNILDALRWVLGEQRVSLLRGSKMEEVIFNGTRDLKPLGMAEVTLSLANDRGVLPTEYSNVQITRRLFRSGESEYLLNKVPCRLKDIQELFYDTGMGAHSYSVIQQDMIESVISDKAEERRFLFEEAAGITKYKQRKRAALRKLEATEQDLLRLNDIYAEVKTQVNSLRRQQKKAERYQEIKDEIRGWDLFLSGQRLEQIDGEKRTIRAAHDELSRNRTGLATRLDTRSADLEAERRRQIELEQQLTAVGNEVYEHSEAAHDLEKHISVLTEKKANARQLIERNRTEITAMQTRLQMLGEQISEAEQTMAGQRAELDRVTGELAEAERQQEAADRELLGARAGREQDNSALIELEGRLSSGRTEEDNLKAQEAELSASIQSYDDQIAELGSRENDARTALAEKSETLDRSRTELATCEQGILDTGRRLEEVQQAIDDAGVEIANLNASVEAAQARRTLLEELILQYDGYGSGVQVVMEHKDRWPGIFDTVAEMFRPDAGMEVATEAALGELARFVVCDFRTTAEAVIDFVRSGRHGKIGILVPDSGAFSAGVKRPQIDHPGFVGWLDDFVSCDPRFTALKSAVLCRTAVYDASFRPDDILERLPYGFKAVSTAGDVYSVNLIAGGSDDRLPLFGRHDRVHQQEKLIEEFERQLRDVTRRKDHQVAELGSLRARHSALKLDRETLTEALADAASLRQEAEYALRSLSIELERIQRERKAAVEKRVQITHRQYSLELDATALTGRRDTLKASLADAAQRLDDIESRAARALERVSALQIRRIECRSQVEQTESRIVHLQELADELNRTTTAKTEEIARAEQEIESSKSNLSRLEHDVKLVFEKRRLAGDRQSQLRGDQAEINELIGAIEADLKDLRKNQLGIADELHQFELRLSTLESERSGIVDRITEEYGTLQPGVTPQRPDSNIDDAQARQHLHQLKERLKQFGAVNLLALEEFKTASEREQFLSAQLDDLSRARNDLRTTIGKINTTARELFNTTFGQVKTNFQNLFQELFTGGEADISLTNPEDPLESDIDIIARPRGKKLLSITMMSGGERALTAISLLFSLYLVKPSPFCILDEIDAPLDDANCRRFLKIIESFSKQTQFITITHNKLTMEAADNLYGVTMEQVGVSKLVAVRFNGGELDVKSTPESDADQQVIDEMHKESGGNGSGHGESSDVVLPEPVASRLAPEVHSASSDKTDT